MGSGEPESTLRRWPHMPSTVIRAYDYDAEAQVLTITFVTGRTYVYFAVPSEAYDDFATAFSKGTFFNKYIRDAYQYREITGGGTSARYARS
jgi:hypothetical protein